MNEKMMTKCKACGGDIAKGVKKCPHCGKDQRNFFMRHKFITGFLILIIAGALFSPTDDNEISKEDEPETAIASQVEEEAVEEKEVVSEKEESVEIEVVEMEKVEEQSAKIPREYTAALNKAKTYAGVMHMSKASLYNQLTSEYGERFPEDAARYAIDNVDANWKENALKKAETYAHDMHMSKASVYDQLTSEYGEKFTSEEAQYAINNVVADWKSNALNKARTYANDMNMSNSAVYDQLISEYGEKFTKEEAQYAIDNL